MSGCVLDPSGPIGKRLNVWPAHGPGLFVDDALGLTVALFVAAEASVDPSLRGQAKMGALLSGGVGLVAVAVGRIFGFGRPAPGDDSSV